MLRCPLRSMRARATFSMAWLVDADGAVGPAGQQFEHPARAGAEVEHRPERAGADGVEDRGLDPLLGDVERAQPSHCVACEAK